MTSGFDYDLVMTIDDHDTCRDALFKSVINYQHALLGWGEEACREYCDGLGERRTAKAVLDARANGGWLFAGRRLLDVGAGQGAMVLEALSRGAEAYGVEPGIEFSTVAERCITGNGYEAVRILRGTGECLPFAGETFDYATCLQVFEHVPHPGPLLSEIYRILKPGGEAFVACVNYLGFWEPHYHVPWLPMLPKGLAAGYLRLLSRDPQFCRKYIFYRTYPEVRRAAWSVGFIDRTVEAYSERLAGIAATGSGPGGAILRCLNWLAPSVAIRLLRAGYPLYALVRSEIRLLLRKPDVRPSTFDGRSLEYV